MPPRWVQWLTLALAAIVAFGVVVPDYYMAADDLFATGMADEISRQGEAGVFEQLVAVVFHAAGKGHFRPVQDALYVVFYAIFGVDRWIFAVMIVYALCHVASGRLVIAILERLRCPARLAFAAGVLFVLHPVFDENLVSVQFGNNVPGLTALLGACLLWLPANGRPRVARLAGAGALFLLAIGLGINLMVSGAVLLGLMTVAIAWARRSVREFLVRGSVLAASLGVGLLHRYFAYGAFGTLHGAYQDIRPSFALGPFLREILDAAVLLTPSPTTRWTETLNPPGLVWDDGAAPWLSSDTVIVVAAAAVLVLVVLFARPGRRGASDAPDARRLAPAFWFGLAVIVSMVLPYFVFLGRVGAHRYVYPAVAGIVIVAAALVGILVRLARRVMPSTAVATLLALLLLATFGLLLRVDREAARSIASAHRVTRAIVSAVAADVATRADSTRVFVVGYPRAIGRAGYTIVFAPHLRDVLNAKLKRKAYVGDPDYFEAIIEGSIPGIRGGEPALYLVEPDGLTVRPVPKGKEGELPRYAVMEGYAALRRRWHLDDPEELMTRLASPNPAVVESVLRVIFELEDGSRSPFVEMTLERSVPSEMLLRGALETARRGGPRAQLLACRVAVLAKDWPDVERDALALVAPDSVDKAKAAAEAERRGERLSRNRDEAAAAAAAFEAALAAWTEAGVPRSDLHHSITLSRLVGFGAEEHVKARETWTTNGWRSLVETLDGFEKSKAAQSIAGVTLRAGGPLKAREAGTAPVKLVIENRSDVLLPGGISPISCRLTCSWVMPDLSTVPAGEQRLPPDGVGIGESRTVDWIAHMPATPVLALQVWLVALGKPFAVTDLLLVP